MALHNHLFLPFHKHLPTKPEGFELYCDYKKIFLERAIIQQQKRFTLKLYYFELSKLIHRFHIWLIVMGIVRHMLDFKGSRKRRKEIILSKIREYRKGGFDVLFSELRIAKLSNGAYIPATGPQDIIIDSKPFNLVEIGFNNKLAIATLTLKSI